MALTFWGTIMSTEQVVQHNIGSIVQEITSIFPAATQAAGTVNGSSIDRQLHQLPLSCLLHLVLGAVTGAPSATSVVATLQHAPDNATWTAFLYDGTHTAQVTGSAATTDYNYAVDLALAYRYLRVSAVVSFTGGSSPSVYLESGLILGGEQLLAAV